jgi:hypothetical protein
LVKNIRNLLKALLVRRWNGDQTDYGLNLDGPTLLKVRLATVR